MGIGNEASIGTSPEPMTGTSRLWWFQQHVAAIFQVNHMGSFSEARFLRGILAWTRKDKDDDDDDVDRVQGERAILINHEYCGEVGMSPSRFKFRLLKYDGFNFIVSQPFLALSLHFAIMHI